MNKKRAFLRRLFRLPEKWYLVLLFSSLFAFSSRFDSFFNDFFDSLDNFSGIFFRADIRGFAFAVDQNVDARNDVDGQTDMSLVLTEGADRLDVDLALVDLDTGFFTDLFSDHLGSDGAVEFARFSGFARESDPGVVDLFGNNGHLSVDLAADDLSFGTNGVSLFDRAGGGQNGETLGDQIVAAVTVSDFLDVAGMAKMIDIF